MSGHLLNVLLYQVGWLLTVASAGYGRPGLAFVIASTVTLLHVALARERRSELRLALLAGLTGLVFDSTEIALGVLTFPTAGIAPGLCPPWIVAMWMQFATTFRFSLAWLLDRPGLAATFGAVGGPLAYRVGEAFDAVTIGSPRWSALLVMGVVWAVAVPALGRVAGRTERAGYRVGS